MFYQTEYGDPKLLDATNYQVNHAAEILVTVPSNDPLDDFFNDVFAGPGSTSFWASFCVENCGAALS